MNRITMERLDECWMCLYDLGQLPLKRLPMRDKLVIDEARHIVNRFQVIVARKKKAADAATPTARKKNATTGQATTVTATCQGEGDHEKA